MRRSEAPLARLLAAILLACSAWVVQWLAGEVRRSAEARRRARDAARERAHAERAAIRSVPNTQHVHVQHVHVPEMPLAGFERRLGYWERRL